MVDPINNPINPASKPNQVQATNAGQQKFSTSGSSSFSDALDQANVKFSNHAQKRLDTRSISMDQNSMDRLSSAVDKAQAHGAKESLILMDDLAFVVNVRDRTVVTTVDMNRRKEGVFTQIDTVVFADPSKATSNSNSTTTANASDTSSNGIDNQKQ
jgi:flagellar operon protein